MTSLSAKPAAATRSAPARAGGTALGSTLDPIKVVRRHILLIIVMGFIGAMLGFGAYVYANKYHPKYTGRVGFELVPQVRSPLDAVARSSDGEAGLPEPSPARRAQA